MPKPDFTATDFLNPDAPDADLRLRPDHPATRDLSYERCRARQLTDLYKQSLCYSGWEDGGASLSSHVAAQPEMLQLFLKQQPRGAGYVADFLYTRHDLLLQVYGILINRGRGLEIAELELFRLTWGYYDAWGDFVGEEGAEHDSDIEDDFQGPLITSDVLRGIPLGKITAMAQQILSSEAWREEGVAVLMGADRGPDELTTAEISALENGHRAAIGNRRGRPALEQSLLIDVARAYLQEAVAGPGLLKRLATRFDRPEATVRDWVGAARRHGFLTPAVRGKRGAGAGPNLPPQVSTTSC